MRAIEIVSRGSGLAWLASTRALLAAVAMCVGCADPGAPTSSDGGTIDARDADRVSIDAARADDPCIDACEACSLAYCGGHCGGARTCIEAAASCEAIRGCIAGPVPERTVWLQPADLATNVDADELGAYASGTLAPSADDALAAALGLTDAVGTAIAATVEVQPADREGDAQLRLRPDAPLAEGWYVLRVEAWPEGYAPAVRVLPGEGRAIRVRVGSAPRLVRVDVCERSRDVWSVAVHASELLRASSLAGATLEREGAPCAMTTLDEGPDGAGGVTFTCDTLAPEENLRVRFPAGATSIGGIALEGPGSADGAALELSRGHAIAISDACVAVPVALEAGVVPAFEAL